MLFHEIYGSYYNVIAAALAEAVKGKLNKKKLQDIIYEKAFDESILNIPDKLAGGHWYLLTAQYKTPLLKEPAMPLTTLQKRWMKALISDPRIQLFEPDVSGLEEIEPLFTPEMLVYYDRSTDGDPFSDAGYTAHFRTILHALDNETALSVEYETARGKKNTFFCCPEYLEYSPKDDRFRVKVRGCSSGTYKKSEVRTLNVSRITECAELEDSTCILPLCKGMNWIPAGEEHRTVTLEVTDFRNTLERILLHFSHLEKETKKLDDRHYIVKLTYDASDETEMLIRILAFGPSVKVVEPEELIAEIRERLKKQSCLKQMNRNQNS
ncbi:MAG: WYL domain-containing protein [Lachnospiraceae bacterium]|nr:WYL domain-containing protein [Lachnospiraceae bacterium]MDY4971599.1 WYL domain-containing protein [Lachnospiraceae bacterium]